MWAVLYMLMSVTVAGEAPRPPDVIMMDKACTVTGAVLGSPKGTPAVTPGTVGMRSCYRFDSKLNCTHEVSGDKPVYLQFNIMDERLSRTVLTSSDMPLVILIDWAQSDFVLSQTYAFLKEGTLMLKVCQGTVTTGEALKAHFRRQPQSLD